MIALSIVYVLTNPAMPGLVKIGMTTGEDAAVRLAQLYTTGVPFPFDLEFACRVGNPMEVERALHTAFGPQRVNPRREFFRIEPAQAIAILRLLHTEDATQEIAAQPDGIESAEVAAAKSFKAKRPRLNFEELGIPIGAQLVSVHQPDTAVQVVSPRKVRIGDEELSLSAITQRVLDVPYAVAPGPHWTYEGKLLRAIYNETYPEDTDEG